MSSITAHGPRHLIELLSHEPLDRASVSEAVRSLAAESAEMEQLCAALVLAEDDRRQLRDRVGELERQLAERVDCWELLAHASNEGVWDWIPGTDHMHWSPQLTRMLGYADGEITPSVAAFNGLLHPDDHALVWRAFDDHAAGKTALCESEFRLRGKDGSYRRIRSRGKARIDARGSVVRMAGVHTHATPIAPNAPEATPEFDSTDLLHSRELCGLCHRDTLVRSRWRPWELPMMLLLKRPVRCRSCLRRQFKPLWSGVPKWTGPRTD